LDIIVFVEDLCDFMGAVYH
jgi:hypothetical protein